MNSNPCPVYREQLVDYADGELTAAEHRQVADHLDVCPACRARLRTLQRSLELAHGVWEQSAPPVDADFMPHVPTPETATCASSASRPGTPTRRALAAAMAASIVFVGATIAMLARGPQPTEDVDIERLISLETRTARLRVAAELLASQPGLENEAAQAEAYLAEISARLAQQP